MSKHWDYEDDHDWDDDYDDEIPFGTNILFDCVNTMASFTLVSGFTIYYAHRMSNKPTVRTMGILFCHHTGPPYLFFS